MKEYNYEKMRIFFTLEEEKKLIGKLIDKWETNSKEIQICRSSIPKNPSYPYFTLWE